MRVSLNIFLFRSDIITIDDAFNSCDLKSYKELDQPNGAIDFNARCFVDTTQSPKPRWLKFYESGFTIDDNFLMTRSASLVLLLESNGRVFGITAGSGYHRIPKSALVRDFGLKATLNAVGNEDLKSLQSRTLDPLTVQKLIVSNQGTTLRTLGIDPFRELLSKIEGKPDDQSIAFTLAGSDSLNINTDIEFADLPAKCDLLLKLSRKKKYRANYAFIDQVKPVRDTSIIKRLDENLRQTLVTPGNTPISLALPTIDRYGCINTYSAYHGRRVLVELLDLQFNLLSPELATLPNDTDYLSKIRIVGSDGTGEPIEDKSLSEWIVAELKLDGKLYIRSAGSWYLVHNNYVSEVNASIQRIKLIEKQNYLPKIRVTNGNLEHEGDYNKRCVNKKRICLDQKNITMERYGAVEPCDLYTDQKHLIHVKKQTSSATLSHLWGQGLVSAQLLLESKDFRKKLKPKLGALKNTVPLAGITPADFTVVYAIISNNTDFPLRLPFFSKVNLLHHHREITRMGYKVKLFRIDHA